MTFLPSRSKCMPSPCSSCEALPRPRSYVTSQNAGPFEAGRKKRRFFNYLAPKICKTECVHTYYTHLYEMHCRSWSYRVRQVDSRVVASSGVCECARVCGICPQGETRVVELPSDWLTSCALRQFLRIWHIGMMCILRLKKKPLARVNLGTERKP